MKPKHLIAGGLVVMVALSALVGGTMVLAGVIWSLRDGWLNDQWRIARGLVPKDRP